MQLKDIAVEVRDKGLVRHGLIRPEELDLELTDLHNNVGTWKLKLAAEHPMTAVLRQPGSGIVVSGPDQTEMFSGPRTKREYAATADDPGGSIVFEGVSDSVILSDYLAFPQPSVADPTLQGTSHDVRTGKTEALMHAYVNANIGPDAPAARRKANLVMGANLNRGSTVKKSARFKPLGTLLTELAIVDNLGFRVIQRGNNLAFETYAVVDRSTEIRLDVRNGTLAGQRVAVTPPGVTQVIVAGQNEGVKRQFVHLSTFDSRAAEAAWGRRIERFIDQRQTDDMNELTQAGLEVLIEEGSATLAVQAVPMEDSAMSYGQSWGLGDAVAVVVDEDELVSTVTGYVIKANADGFKLGSLIGDRATLDPDAELDDQVADTEARVSALERNAEGTAGLDDRVGTLETTSLKSGEPADPSMLRLTATGDLTLSSTDHAFQIGPNNGANLAMDQNEIQARNNGAKATLIVQADSGDTTFNANASSPTENTVTMRANLAVEGLFDPSNIAAGAVQIIPTANTPTSMTWSYGKTLPNPIRVTTAANTAVPGSSVVTTSFSSVTTTSALIWIYRTNTTSTSVHAIAIGGLG